MPRTIASLVVSALLALAGCAPKESVKTMAEAGPAVAWPKTPCRASVEAFLSMGGLSLAQMQTVAVREERLNGGQPGEQVGYWIVGGRPETCAGGGITLTILPNCAISSWKTSGGCRVAGLEAGR